MVASTAGVRVKTGDTLEGNTVNQTRTDLHEWPLSKDVPLPDGMWRYHPVDGYTVDGWWIEYGSYYGFMIADKEPLVCRGDFKPGSWFEPIAGEVPKACPRHYKIVQGWPGREGRCLPNETIVAAAFGC